MTKDNDHGALALVVTVDYPDREPRTRDVDLGVWLEYKDPLHCRELIKKLIKAKKINDSDILRVARGDGPRAKGQTLRNPGVEFHLTREQALKVAVLSGQPKGLAALDALIDCFLRAQKLGYLEKRILQFEARCDWDAMWSEDVLQPICNLYGWPVYVEGRMYQPIAGIMDQLYELTLGTDAYREIQKRNPHPEFTKNHHQLMAPETREMFRRDLRDIALIASTSGRREEFWAKLERHFRKGMLQMDIKYSAKKKRLGKKKP